MRNQKKKAWIGFLAVLALGVIVLFLPPVWSRVSYYVNQLYTDLFYKINPPEEVVFNPGQSTPDDVATAVQATLQALAPQMTPTPQATMAPTATQKPLPASVYLEGVEPEAQMWNNCGPSTLSMNLSFWHWVGSQEDTAAVLKPNERDKNVMPYEMADFVNQNTDLRALLRMGGDLYTLKSLVSAGFPVLLEKGYDPLDRTSHDLGWMGHYNLVIGYDDTTQAFMTQDSYLLALIDDYQERMQTRGFEVTYDDMLKNWRAFNYVFIVVYPPDLENDVLNTLGPLADETNSYRVAYDRAVAETTLLTDPRDNYFAWFNVGTSLVKLQDYTGAASAYDTTFAVYPTIEEARRPYRMMWYQTGPYYAYYYAGRYQDVITLATTTLDAEVEHLLEESYHWRALAEEELGNREAAVADLRNALRVHPGFAPSYEQLVNFGETP